MIQVQIASTLERDGVGAARWVLVDSGEFDRYPAAAGAAAADRTARPAAEDAGVRRPLQRGVRRAGLGVQVACAAVLLSALAGAWSVTSVLLAAEDHGARAAAQAGPVGR
jgi:hypothetical protein